MQTKTNYLKHKIFSGRYGVTQIRVDSGRTGWYRFMCHAPVTSNDFYSPTVVANVSLGFYWHVQSRLGKRSCLPAMWRPFHAIWVNSGDESPEQIVLWFQRNNFYWRPIHGCRLRSEYPTLFVMSARYQHYGFNRVADILFLCKFLGTIFKMKHAVACGIVVMQGYYFSWYLGTPFSKSLCLHI